jgi:predicted ATP-dependent serine protease
VANVSNRANKVNPSQNVREFERAHFTGLLHEQAQALLLKDPGYFLKPDALEVRLVSLFDRRDYKPPAWFEQTDRDRALSEACERARMEFHPEQHIARKAGFQTVRAHLKEVAARARQKNYWDQVLREGELGMLAGRAMAGKSTFACALTRALTLGLPLLGRDCRAVKVAYLALERNGDVVARLFEKWGLGDQVLFSDEVPATRIAALAEYFERQIREREINVMVVDHLQNLLQIEDSNDYAQVSKALDPFQRVAKTTGVHILVLHHQGKTVREGPIDVMGSEAYRASVDALVEAKARDGLHFIRAQVRGAPELP